MSHVNATWPDDARVIAKRTEVGGLPPIRLGVSVRGGDLAAYLTVEQAREVRGHLDKSIAAAEAEARESGS